MSSSNSDEEDIHQCGRCKDIFKSIEEYFQHKKSKACKKNREENSRKTPPLLETSVEIASSFVEDNSQEQIDQSKPQTVNEDKGVLRGAKKRKRGRGRKSKGGKVRVVQQPSDNKPEVNIVTPEVTASEKLTQSGGRGRGRGRARSRVLQAEETRGKELETCGITTDDNDSTIKHSITEKAKLAGDQELQPSNEHYEKTSEKAVACLEKDVSQNDTEESDQLQLKNEFESSRKVNFEKQNDNGQDNSLNVKDDVPAPRRSRRDIKCKKRGYLMTNHDDDSVNIKEDAKENVLNDLISDDKDYFPGSTRGKRGRPPKRMVAVESNQQRVQPKQEVTNIQCHLCEQWFSTKKDQKKHMKVAHPPKISLKRFTCEMCQAPFPKRMLFLQHLEKVHGISDMHKDDFQCPVCDRQFNAKNHILRHRETLHAPSQQVPMDQIEHLESMSPDGPPEPFTEEMADKTKEGLFICFICKKLLDKYETYKKHLEFHREWIPNPDRVEMIEIIKNEDERRRKTFVDQKIRNPHVEHSYMYKEKNQKPSYQPTLLPNGQPIIQRITQFDTVDTSAIGGVIQENNETNNDTSGNAYNYDTIEPNQESRFEANVNCTEIIIKPDESQPEDSIKKESEGMSVTKNTQRSDHSEAGVYSVSVEHVESTDNIISSTNDKGEPLDTLSGQRSACKKTSFVPMTTYSSSEKDIQNVTQNQSATTSLPNQVSIQQGMMQSIQSVGSVSPTLQQMNNSSGHMYMNQPLLRHALTNVTHTNQGNIASQAPQLTELITSSLQHGYQSTSNDQGGNANHIVLQPNPYQGQRLIQAYQIAPTNVPVQQVTSMNQGVQQQQGAKEPIVSSIQVSGYSGGHLITHHSVANTSQTNTLPHVEEIMNRDNRLPVSQVQQQGQSLDSTGQQATVNIPLHQYLQNATGNVQQQIVYAQSSGGHVLIPGQSVAQIQYQQNMPQLQKPVTSMTQLISPSAQGATVSVIPNQTETNSNTHSRKSDSPNAEISKSDSVQKAETLNVPLDNNAVTTLASGVSTNENSLPSFAGVSSDKSESYVLPTSKQVDGATDPGDGSSSDEENTTQEYVEEITFNTKDIEEKEDKNGCNDEQGINSEMDTDNQEVKTQENVIEHEKTSRETDETHETVEEGVLDNGEQHPARLLQNRDPIAAAFAASVLGDNTGEISLEEGAGGLLYTIEHISEPGEDGYDQMVLAAVKNNGDDDEPIDEFDVDTMCPFCKKIVDNLDDMYHHKIEEHGLLPVFKCVVEGCGKHFFAVIDHKSHGQIHPQRAFICSICNIHMPTMDAILGHKSVAHRNTARLMEDISCPICHQLFKTRDELQQHIKSGGHKRYFQCNECGKVFRTQGDLMNHKPQHSGIRGFLCDICGSTFYNKNGLNRHRLMHFAKRIHVCEHCDKCFNKKEHLKRHVATQHVVARPYKCTKCTKSFKRIDKLKDHQRMHSDEKPYVCELCGKGYRYREGLRYHIKTHDRPMNHLCGICGLKFSRPSQVRHHVKNSHGIEVKDMNVYPCQKCGHNFPRPERLQRHLERDHRVEVNWSHKCPLCSRGFPGKKSLETHLQKRHIENDPAERTKKPRRQKKSETVQEKLMQARKLAQVEQARIDAELQAQAENAVTQQLLPVMPPLQTVEIHTIKGTDDVQVPQQASTHQLLQQMPPGAVVEVSNLPQQVAGAPNPMMVAVNAPNQQVVHIQSPSPGSLQGQGQSQGQTEQTVIPVQQVTDQLPQNRGLQPGVQYAHGPFQYIAYSS